MTRRLDQQAINELRSRTSIVEEVSRRIKLRRFGREMRGLCPFHPEETASLDVNETKGVFVCRGCGATGDVLQFIMRYDGVSFRDAVALLNGDTSLAPPDPAVLRQREKERALLRERESLEAGREIERARALCAKARPGAGTLVEVYLDARGLHRHAWPDRFPSAIRFLPDLPYWHKPLPSGKNDDPPPVILARLPAMIGVMQDPAGNVRAAHITYLRPDGSDKMKLFSPDTGEELPSKKMRGRPWGAFIPLSAYDGTRPLVIGEGIETTATVYQVEGGTMHALVAGSLNNLAGHGEGIGPRHPTRFDREGKPMRLPSPVPDMGRPGLVLPECCKDLIYLGDADGSDPLFTQYLLHRAQARALAEGRAPRVAMAPPGCDFNDLVRPNRGAA